MKNDIKALVENVALLGYRHLANQGAIFLSDRKIVRNILKENIPDSYYEDLHTDLKAKVMFVDGICDMIFIAVGSLSKLVYEYTLNKDYAVASFESLLVELDPEESKLFKDIQKWNLDRGLVSYIDSLEFDMFIEEMGETLGLEPTDYKKLLPEHTSANTVVTVEVLIEMLRNIQGIMNELNQVCPKDSQSYLYFLNVVLEANNRKGKVKNKDGKVVKDNKFESPDQTIASYIKAYEREHGENIFGKLICERVA